MENVIHLMKGFGTNLLITFIPAFILLCIGIPLSILVKFKPVVGKVLYWVRIPFECVCIPIFAVICFYVPVYLLRISINRFWPFVISFIIAYLFYIPSRYNNDFSFLKNTLFNGLGLVSALLKWSFIVGLLAVSDALNSTMMFLGFGVMWPIVVVFLITFFILAILEISRTIIKNHMK